MEVSRQLGELVDRTRTVRGANPEKNKARIPVRIVRTVEVKDQTESE